MTSYAGRGERPAGAWQVLDAGEVLPGLRRQQPVVPEVLVEPVLHDEAPVFTHPRADAGPVEAHVDTGGAQVVGGTDARELQQVRGLQAAERQDHDLAARVMVDHVGAAPHLHAGRPFAVEQRSWSRASRPRPRGSGGLLAGWRNASAALTLRPLRMVAIV